MKKELIIILLLLSVVFVYAEGDSSESAQVWAVKNGACEQTYSTLAEGQTYPTEESCKTALSQTQNQPIPLPSTNVKDHINTGKGMWIIVGDYPDEKCINVTLQEYQYSYPSLRWYTYEAECQSVIAAAHSKTKISGWIKDKIYWLKEKIVYAIGGKTHQESLKQAWNSSVFQYSLWIILVLNVILWVVLLLTSKRDEYWERQKILWFASIILLLGIFMFTGYPQLGVGILCFGWLLGFFILAETLSIGGLDSVKNIYIYRKMFYDKKGETKIWRTIISGLVFVGIYFLLSMIPVVNRIFQFLTLQFVLDGKATIQSLSDWNYWNLFLQSLVLAFEVLLVPEAIVRIRIARKRKEEYEDKLKEYVGKEVAKTMADA